MARALVGTSVWIEFYHPQGDLRVKQIIQEASETDDVALVVPVIVELLSGAKSEPAYRLLRRDVSGFDLLPLTRVESDMASKLAWTLARAGKLVPITDLLIAGAAQAHDYEIWHFGDKHFAIIEAVKGPRQRDLKKR